MGAEDGSFNIFKKWKENHIRKSNIIWIQGNFKEYLKFNVSLVLGFACGLSFSVGFWILW